MYRLIYLSIYLSILIGLPLYAFGPFTLHFSSADFNFYREYGEDGVLYDRISGTGYNSETEPGAPELPIKILHYIIPPDMVGDAVEITVTTQEIIPGTYNIYPTQPAVPLDSIPPWVVPDSLIYGSDSLYSAMPIKLLETGSMDGARIVTIGVYPFQYRPLTKRLYILTDITFEFALSSATPPPIPTVRGIYDHALITEALEDLLANPEHIPAYAPVPPLVPDEELLDVQRRFGKYVIITSPELQSAFQPLTQWLTDRGVPAITNTTSWIYSRYSGVDGAEKVRNYIIDAHYNYGTFSGLLAGDDGLVPIRYSYNGIPTDMYFSDLNGDWDADGDGQWGEPWDDEVDVWPEVSVGRVAVRNAVEVENWIEKEIHYERYGSDSLSRLTDDFWQYAYIHYPDSMDPRKIIDWDWPLDEHDGVPGRFYRPLFTCYPQPFEAGFQMDADKSVQAHSKGYGYAAIYCHGEPTAYNSATATNGGNFKKVKAFYEGQDYYKVAGLNHLTNEGRYGITYSISCDVAAFDLADTTVMDAFTDAYPKKGSVAFLGNTRAGLWTTSGKLHWRFAHKVFHCQGIIPHLGWAEAFSKLYVPNWYVRYSHNLFGSPELDPWTNIPRDMAVTHPGLIGRGDTTTFTVTVEDADNHQPLWSTIVCLNKPGDIYKIGKTNSAGQVTFTICPKSTGQMKVTCARNHYLGRASHLYLQWLPSQTFCDVLPSIYPPPDTFRVSRPGSQDAGSGPIVPTELSLTLASNPVSRSAEVICGIPVETRVRLAVYNTLGARVALLDNKVLPPGFYRMKADLRKEGISPGIYWLILEQGNERVTRKLVLLR